MFTSCVPASLASFVDIVSRQGRNKRVSGRGRPNEELGEVEALEEGKKVNRRLIISSLGKR